MVQDFLHQQYDKWDTPPKFDMEPEQGPLKKEKNIYKPRFVGFHVIFFKLV